jgi:PBP1b-binding outer membrane lipoprotein LpoB
MKKVFAILAIAGFMASCNNDAKTEGEKKDSTAVTTDTTAKAPVDTTAKPAADTTAKKDTAAKM